MHIQKKFQEKLFDYLCKTLKPINPGGQSHRKIKSSYLFCNRSHVREYPTKFHDQRAIILHFPPGSQRPKQKNSLKITKKSL